MGTYPKVKLVALDRWLRDQHERKRSLKKLKASTKELHSPEWISREVGLPQPYIRRVAWEAGLDCFPGPKQSNDIWLACYAVVYLGWPTREASRQLGFTIPSIENTLRAAGWKRHVLWGHHGKKHLVVPRPFKDGRWRLSRNTPGFDTTGTLDYAQFAYFRKRHH